MPQQIWYTVTLRNADGTHAVWSGQAETQEKAVRFAESDHSKHSATAVQIQPHLFPIPERCAKCGALIIEGESTTRRKRLNDSLRCFACS